MHLHRCRYIHIESYGFAYSVAQSVFEAKADYLLLFRCLVLDATDGTHHSGETCPGSHECKVTVIHRHYLLYQSACHLCYFCY